ncbi:MAG: hypothetical protein IJU03_08190 [Thermoguttaceae bacterium]|nr:hypothetical protein [Thermoguttaceae bacterium]
MSFIKNFCNAVATQLTEYSPTVELFANYDVGKESDLKLTICPAANAIHRAGRGVGDDRVTIDVVVQKRVDSPTLDACEEPLNLLRDVAFKLADLNIEVNGLKYMVAEIDNSELFDEVQLEESNVFSATMRVEYSGQFAV